MVKELKIDLKTTLTCVAVYAIMGGVMVLMLNFSPTGGRRAVRSGPVRFFRYFLMDREPDRS